jgi:phosphatidylglycerol:prolipoprotein diacylglycerol transferase
MWPRWYGLAYVAAFVSSYFLFLWLSKRGYADLPPQRVSDFITGCALFGVIVGGRLGYVFFYKPEMLREPLSILRVWKAGCRVTAGWLAYCCSRFTTRAVTKFRG